jgi:protein AroM
MRAILGCITVGQSPRTDVTPDITAVLGSDIQIVEAGALDGLTLKEVTALAPRPGQSALASRMADGTGIAIAKEAILDRIEGCIDRVIAQGATAILIICTGKFPTFASSVPIYQPDQLLRGAIAGLVSPGQRLGVISPLEAQVPSAPVKWGGDGQAVMAVSASPYHGEEIFLEGARKLIPLHPDVILLDCMGFRETHKGAARRIFPDKPIILANTAAVRLLSEVL